MLRSLFCFVLFGLALRSFAFDVAWPLPTPPPGTNPALFATPRQDWFSKFQGNLDRTRDKHFDLVFDGDSITDYWWMTGKDVWNTRYRTISATNFGISADKVEHVLWRVQQGELDGIDPKLIVLMIGTNNTGRDTADQIAEGITNLVGEYLKRAPNAHLLLLGIFPRSALPTDPIRAKIADINKQIAGLDGDRVTYLDIGAKFLEPDGTLSKEIMPDFLHPSAKGYAIWADAIQSVIEQFVPKRG